MYKSRMTVVVVWIGCKLGLEVDHADIASACCKVFISAIGSLQDLTMDSTSSTVKS